MRPVLRLLLVFSLISFTRLGWYFVDTGCHPTAMSVAVISLAFAVPFYAFHGLRLGFAHRGHWIAIGLGFAVSGILFTPVPRTLTQHACP